MILSSLPCPHSNKTIIANCNVLDNLMQSWFGPSKSFIFLVVASKMTNLRCSTYKNTCLQGTLFRQALQFIHLSFSDGYKKRLHRIPEPTERQCLWWEKLMDVTVVYLGFVKSVGLIPVTCQKHSFLQDNKASPATTDTYRTTSVTC